MEATATPPPGYFVRFPITLGPNWQPGDIRVLCLEFFNNFQTNFLTNNSWQNPPGFTIGVDTPDPATTGGLWRTGMSWRRLVAGDADTFITFNRPDLMVVFGATVFTVRGVDPAFTPAPATYGFTGAFNDGLPHPGGTAAVSSQTVPSAGTVSVFMTASVDPHKGLTGGACALGIPTGWTNLVATDKSGLTFLSTESTPSSILVAKSYAAAGSTGTVNFPFANAMTPWFAGVKTFWKPAPDVSVTATAPAAVTTTAAAATFSTSTAVTVTAPGASCVTTATTAFNPLRGMWVSDPLTLPGDPVTSSVLRWATTTPAGTSATVESSINNGASWDAATNNRPVPRLAEGDTVTRSVLVRAVLTRTLATDTPPKLTMLDLQVSVDAGVDELVAVGHGMIDKVTVKATAGPGGSSSTGGIGSSAVTSKGGGQTGGGTTIKVHVTDLSRAIKRNLWAQPFTVPSGLNYGDAAMAMVRDRLPSQTDFSIASTARLTPLLVYGMDQGGDPWQDIQDVAAAIGFEAFFDPRGVFVFRPVPDPRLGEPVWTFDEDSNPTVVEASRELSDEQTINHVIVIGQSTSSQNPVTAEAFDNDPSSPTYILGPYNEVTERLTFPLIIDQGQAQDTANAILYNSLGAADTVTITNVPMPALEPGDIVKINCSNVNANGTYMINAMTTPLSPAEAQQLTCFRQSTNK
jgi:hypothetical protein